MLQLVVFLAISAAVTGFLAVAWLVSWHSAGRLFGCKGCAAPQWGRLGCGEAAQSAMSFPAVARTDSRVTGAAVIDEQLQQAVQFGSRDFVLAWFYVWVSPAPAFPREVDRLALLLLQELAKRCKSADLSTLITQTLPEECLNHITCYKEATDSSDSSGSVADWVFSSMPSSDPWGAVCQQPHALHAYLQDLSEVLLYLTLPGQDFQNPLLRNLLRDCLTQQVLLPLLHVLSNPDFINTTLLAMCKESSLNPETFLTAIRSSRSSSETEHLQRVVWREKERLKKRGVSDSDQQRLASLNVVEMAISHQLQGQQDDIPEDAEISLPLSFSVTIPTFELQPGRHVAFLLQVQCCHVTVEVVENWTTLRRFSDFHDLHISLRSALGSLPPTLSLPPQRSLKRLEPAFLDARRVGLEHYLQTVVSEQFLSRHPQALQHVLSFVSDSTYKRSSNELNRQVDRLMNPFRRHTVSSKLESSIKSEATSSPSLLRRNKTLSEFREASMEEEEDLDLPLALLEELFDLRKQGQWLRRQLAHMLSQLIGDRVSRKMADIVDWLTSPEQVAEYCRDVTNVVWPGGFRPAPANQSSKDDSEEDSSGVGVGCGGDGEGADPTHSSLVAMRCLLARAKLIGSIPDDLRTLLGSSTTSQGMARLSDLFQDSSLNRLLILRLLETCMDTLFPGQGLSSTLCSLRCHLSSS